VIFLSSDHHVEKASDTRKKPQAGLIAKSSSFHSIIFLRWRCRFTAWFLLQERLLPSIVGVAAAHRPVRGKDSVLERLIDQLIVEQEMDGVSCAHAGSAYS
jgi:hypothetical protein